MCEVVLNKIVEEYKKILKNNLIGIYVHGSLAFHCFNPQKSDIDFIVVVDHDLILEEKVLLIQVLLDLQKLAPAKGFEMSVVLESICQNLIYPTPYILHYSNAHLTAIKKDILQYCENMHGVDKDLAAHFQVILSVGYPIYGKDSSEVFSIIPKEYYLDSILSDVENAKKDILVNPTYIILNLCRVWAYQKDKLILSKKMGGLWGIQNIKKYKKLIQNALDDYINDKSYDMNSELLKEFAEYMLKKILNKNKYMIK